MTKLSPEEPKRIEAEADEAYQAVPWQFVNNMSFHCCYMNGYKKAAIHHAEKAQPLVEALNKILPLLKCSGEIQMVHAVHLSPSEQLRRQAKAIEDNDAAIREARAALNAYLAGGRK